jgi:hypothetical protein
MDRPRPVRFLTHLPAEIDASPCWKGEGNCYDGFVPRRVTFPGLARNSLGKLSKRAPDEERADHSVIQEQPMNMRQCFGPARSWILLAISALVLLAIAGCGGGQNDLVALAADRDMSPEDAARAIKSFVPPGKHDEFN